MKKEYEKFVEELRLALLSTTGMKEDRIFFRRKGEPLAETGDRLFVECAEDEDTVEICGIYTEELYERYEEEESLEALTEEVTAELQRAQQKEFLDNTKKLVDYNQVKDLLFIRPLNVRVHRQSLRRAVYRIVGDIALVLYMKVYEQEDSISSTKIRTEYIARWGVEWEKVFEDALLNTMRISPPRLYQWENLLYDPEYTGDSFMEFFSNARVSKDTRGNCLSTVKRTNGAVAIFLPGVARRLGDLMGHDLYLAFTSIHEVMVHNADAVNPEELERVLVETIRETTPKEDFLSGHIYYYSRRTGEFSCL